jgi:hypothetical protein
MHHHSIVVPLSHSGVQAGGILFGEEFGQTWLGSSAVQLIALSHL